ncbi:MAG: MGMT family protein [Candidatus Magasanikbacteria bacterium]|nr:MGMT family protein [Candidatus Magasanikbacteria bacterium]
MLTFTQKVKSVVAKISKGKVLTYGEVARKSGRPRAARAVGKVINKNYDPKIPCHRVARSDGKIGDYNRGIKLKITKLKNEGIKNIIKKSY